MNNQNNQYQVNAEEVINSLSQQIANLTKDNAYLNSLINQYQRKVHELEQQTQENTESDEQVE